MPEAEGLGTSLPSVGAMIKRMEREGFLKIDTKTNEETIIGNVTDAQYPNGRESDDEVSERNRSFRNDKLAETKAKELTDPADLEILRTSLAKIHGGEDVGDVLSDESLQSALEKITTSVEGLVFDYDGMTYKSVSYTHLTLPTICSV